MEQKLQQLEERIKKLEDNQIGVIMTDNADTNVLRSVQRALLKNNLTIGSSSTPATSTSSLLILNSITKGLLFPRMTTTQRNAIMSPTAGLVVYNTTTGVLNFYNGVAWGAV